MDENWRMAHRATFRPGVGFTPVCRGAAVASRIPFPQPGRNAALPPPPFLPRCSRFPPLLPPFPSPLIPPPLPPRLLNKVPSVAVRPTPAITDPSDPKRCDATWGRRVPFSGEHPPFSSPLPMPAKNPGDTTIRVEAQVQRQTVALLPSRRSLLPFPLASKETTIPLQNLEQVDDAQQRQLLVGNEPQLQQSPSSVATSASCFQKEMHDIADNGVVKPLLYPIPPKMERDADFKILDIKTRNKPPIEDESKLQPLPYAAMAATPSRYQTSNEANAPYQLLLQQRFVGKESHLQQPQSSVTCTRSALPSVADNGAKVERDVHYRIPKTKTDKQQPVENDSKLQKLTVAAMATPCRDELSDSTPQKSLLLPAPAAQLEENLSFQKSEKKRWKRSGQPKSKKSPARLWKKETPNADSSSSVENDSGYVCFLKNLPPAITLREIRDMFRTETMIDGSVRMHYSGETREPTGNCLLAFSTLTDAQRACEKVNKKTVFGRELEMYVVQLSS